MLDRHELIKRCADALRYEVEEHEDKLGKHWRLKNVIFLDCLPAIYDPTRDYVQAMELIETFKPNITYLPSGEFFVTLGHADAKHVDIKEALVQCVAKSKRKVKKTKRV